jgi:hypothetical protein
MRWVGGEMKEIHTKFYMENLKERGHFKDVGIYDRIKLKRVVKK